MTYSDICIYCRQVVTMKYNKRNSSGDEVVNVNFFTMMSYTYFKIQLECGPMPNVMAALPNIGGALCSTPQSLANAHYKSAVQ